MRYKLIVNSQCELEAHSFEILKRIIKEVPLVTNFVSENHEHLIEIYDKDEQSTIYKNDAERARTLALTKACIKNLNYKVNRLEETLNN